MGVAVDGSGIVVDLLNPMEWKGKAGLIWLLETSCHPRPVQGDTLLFSNVSPFVRSFAQPCGLHTLLIIIIGLMFFAESIMASNWVVAVSSK